MLPPNGSIALTISFECMLLHLSARFRILDQLSALIGGSIGLGTTVIFDAAQLARLFAAPLNALNWEED